MTGSTRKPVQIGSVALVLLATATGCRQHRAQPESNPPERSASDSDSASDPDPGDGWVLGSTSVSTGTNSAGERYELAISTRYRLAGDQVTLESSYVADDVAVDEVATELIPIGLAVIEGEASWALALEPNQTKRTTTTLRASGDGLIQLAENHRSGSSGGGTAYRWLCEGGRLYSCEQRDCVTPVLATEPLSGTRITVSLQNDCEVGNEFVVHATTWDTRPPESLPVHSLQPGERRTIEIDQAQSILRRYPDGHYGGGAQPGEDGATIRFSGSGPDCGTIESMPPGS